MIQDFYKIAGELCSAVLHVTARSLATSKPHTADHFTVGLASPETSLPIGKPFDLLPSGTKQRIFWGLGYDVTVGTNK